MNTPNDKSQPSDPLEQAMRELDASGDAPGSQPEEDINALLADRPDTLAGVEYKEGQSVAEESLNEMHELKRKFIESGKKEQEGYVLSNDSEYWCCLVFQTREQKDAFLLAMDWLKQGDKYIDGQWVAKKQGVALPPSPAALGYYLKDSDRIDKKMAGAPAITVASPKTILPKG